DLVAGFQKAALDQLEFFLVPNNESIEMEIASSILPEKKLLLYCCDGFEFPVPT
ncbi:18950_t:CDS:2, partial [Gigaspora rosea]